MKNTQGMERSHQHNKEQGTMAFLKGNQLQLMNKSQHLAQLKALRRVRHQEKKAEEIVRYMATESCKDDMS
jgi:hypothetical protein